MRFLIDLITKKKYSVLVITIALLLIALVIVVFNNRIKRMDKGEETPVQPSNTKTLNR